MGFSVLVGALAVACSFLSALFGARALFCGLPRRGLKDGVRAGGILVEGVRGLKGPSRVILGFSQVKHLIDVECRFLERKGVAASSQGAASAAMLVLISSCAVGLFVSGSALFGCLAPVLVSAVGLIHARTEEDRERQRVREAVPEVLESMADCFGSGYSLMQVLGYLAERSDDAVSPAFREGYGILRTGGTAERALLCLKNLSDSADLGFVSVALAVHHRSGGSIQATLKTAADSAKSELALKRSLRSQTAQARLSARIVSIMPLVLVSAFSFASPGFLMPFVSSPLGWVLFVLAVSMQAGGIFLVRRSLRVGDGL